jgi:ubiquinone/menaquinone biosynthesis C-methylase UbiE
MELFSDKGPYAGLFEINFGIKPGDKVLDVGGGHKPFGPSTHVADFVDHEEQRHGQKLNLEGRELIEGDVCETLEKFDDNFFDFCYSNHTFEHIVDLRAALEQISRVCKRGFYALPGSDFEFLTAKNHFGHVNLCRQIGDVLHFCKRPEGTIVQRMAELFEERLFRHPQFNALWEGHGVRGLRYIWEIRYMWQDKILYKKYEGKEAHQLFPQLKYFEEN